jgi:hypothetical protein
MKRPDPVDLLMLYSKGSANGWNEFLNDCFKKQDVGRLTRMRQALQSGMDNLVKQKLDTEDLAYFFIRLQRSCDQTMKAILRSKYPNPLDNSLKTNTDLLANSKWKQVKTQRDQEFEQYLRKASW